jgi:hypothetical protein
MTPLAGSRRQEHLGVGHPGTMKMIFWLEHVFIPLSRVRGSETIGQARTGRPDGTSVSTPLASAVPRWHRPQSKQQRGA